MTGPVFLTPDFRIRPRLYRLVLAPQAVESLKKKNDVQNLAENVQSKNA